MSDQQCTDPSWLAAWKARQALHPVPESAHELEPEAPKKLRVQSGAWAPGQSGNPAGRKPGSLNRGGQLRAMLAEGGEELIRVVLAKALAGNVEALRLCLERVAPPLRPDGRCVSFQFDMHAPFTVQAQQIANAVASGELCVEDGALMIQALTNAAGLKQIDELEERIRELEDRAAKAARSFGGGMVVANIDDKGNIAQ